MARCATPDVGHPIDRVQGDMTIFVAFYGYFRRCFALLIRKHEIKIKSIVDREKQYPSFRDNCDPHTYLMASTL
jgi:hypothetical protein